MRGWPAPGATDLDRGTVPTGFIQAPISLKPVDPKYYDPKTRVVVWDALADKAMAGLKSRFEEYGHEPTAEHWRGLRQIARSLSEWPLD